MSHRHLPRWLVATVLCAALTLLACASACASIGHVYSYEAPATSTTPALEFVSTAAVVNAGSSRAPQLSSGVSRSLVATEEAPLGSDIGISGPAGKFDLDELAQLVYRHIGGGEDVAGRSTLGEIKAALKNGSPNPVQEQDAVQFDYDGTRVIINENLPAKSTAVYP